MQNRNTIVLILILLLALLTLYIDLPIDQPRWVKQALFWQQPADYRDLKIKQGLDLQGGTQVILVPRPIGNN